tara:strand:+ start:602 stop:724 length:123 start_codon:yes stop_codon:yes gene_type:complete
LNKNSFLEKREEKMKQSVEITNDQVSISSVKDVFKFGGKE